MIFGIMVNAGPYQHQGADSAYHFTKAALDSGHQIHRVFFYHDGVNNASDLMTPPQDERHIQRRWSDLARTYDVDLVVCVAAAQRRGVMDERESRRHAKASPNLAPAFRISGIGQLLETAIASDRLMVFGG